jgi:hypothetical protein
VCDDSFTCQIEPANLSAFFALRNLPVEDVEVVLDIGKLAVRPFTISDGRRACASRGMLSSALALIVPEASGPVFTIRGRELRSA